MKLLLEEGTSRIYLKVNQENTWTDPVLILASKKKEEPITVSSGELELPLGTFVINENFVKDIDEVEALLTNLVDKDSVTKLSDKRTKFTLKEEYVEKIKNLYQK